MDAQKSPLCFAEKLQGKNLIRGEKGVYQCLSLQAFISVIPLYKATEGVRSYFKLPLPLFE